MALGFNIKVCFYLYLLDVIQIIMRNTRISGQSTLNLWRWLLTMILWASIGTAGTILIPRLLLVAISQKPFSISTLNGLTNGCLFQMSWIWVWLLVLSLINPKLFRPEYFIENGIAHIDRRGIPASLFNGFIPLSIAAPLSDCTWFRRKTRLAPDSGFYLRARPAFVISFRCKTRWYRFVKFHIVINDSIVNQASWESFLEQANIAKMNDRDKSLC